MPTSTDRKAKSGNPANRAASAKSEFKKKSAGQSLELPSGLVAVVRRLGVTTLLAENIMGDELTSLAQDAVDKAKGGKVPQSEALRDDVLNDPARITAMLEAFDKVVVRSWIDPKVFPAVDVAEDERDEETLYADEIDLADKIFTFNWVAGGSSDLTRFRQQFAQLMEGVPAGEGVGVQAE